MSVTNEALNQVSAFVAFCASRLGGDWGHVLGTRPADIDSTAIIDRAFAC